VRKIGKIKTEPTNAAIKPPVKTDKISGKFSLLNTAMAYPPTPKKAAPAKFVRPAYPSCIVKPKHTVEYNATDAIINSAKCSFRRMIRTVSKAKKIHIKKP
tara:strand:- start:86 stop:388 length:303 start_codon:yes stop_codon:yes gene_type:complete